LFLFPFVRPSGSDQIAKMAKSPAGSVALLLEC